MTITAPAPARPRLLRRALLIGCAAAGLGVSATAANAQAFNALPTTVFGGVGYNRGTPGVETVTVNTNTAVIDWRPTAGVFLPAGNVATFTNGPNNADFVVLNRIISTTPQRFDGTVLSRLVDAGGTTTTGGTVIFSSPGGLIIGSTGVFDVGSLVLTTLNVNVDAGGNFYDPATRGLTFSLAGGPSPIISSLITEPGAQLNALQPNSYVALVGPIIQHGGATRVNGSAAYIAGEQVQFRANQGLFDIIVSVGSDNATPLIHTGSTGGPASTGAGDNHAIYLVAMPKNQAITAVLQGDIGFDPAVAVGVENGVIVLSAGANVVGGTVDRYGDLTGVPAADLAANFEIRGGIVRSDLIGVARTNMRARPVGVASLLFQQDVSLFGGALASMSVTTGQTIDVLGNAIVSAAAFDSFSGAVDLTGGRAEIVTGDGGTIHIFGTAMVDASARGLVGPGGVAGTGTGGTGIVRASGGTITIDGALSILANGEGAASAAAPLNDGGAGTGGTATLEAAAGGRVNANSTVFMNASGTASASNAATQNGATGTGGTVNILAGGAGSVVIAGALVAGANGSGGEVIAGPGLTGGVGDGGTINVRATDGNIDFNADATFLAAGGGGAGPNGGDGLGGDLGISAARGTIDFLGQTNGAVGGFGGDGRTGGQGGDGQGGNVLIIALSSDAPSRIGGGAFSLAAPGQGGQGGNGLIGTPAGNGGSGTGGVIGIFAQSANGTIALGALKLEADGLGGGGGAADNNTDGGDGGTGMGGAVVIGAVAGPTPAGGGPTGSATFATADLSARGTGGFGGFGTGSGGNGVGGTVGVVAGGGPTTVTAGTTLVADGRASPGGGSPGGGIGTGGLATGGTVNIIATAHPGGGAAPGTITLAGVTGSVGALGDGPGNVAGQWHVGASAGSTVTATGLTLTAAAEGAGIGLPPASTLDALDGTITVTGTAQLGTDGDLLVSVGQAGRVAGGRYELNAGRDVVVTHDTPGPGAASVDLANLFIQAGRDVTVDTGAVTRTTATTDIRAVRTVAVNGRVLGRDILIRGADLNLAGGGAIGVDASESVDIQVTGNAAISGLVLGQDIFVSASTINVATTGQAGSEVSDKTELRSTGATTVDGLVVASDVLVTAGSLNVAATGAIGSATTTQTVGIQVTGNAGVAGQVLGRNIVMNAAAINVGTTGTVGGAATDLADLNAAGTIAVSGRVLGDAIRLASLDIDIATNGIVGDAGTQLVTLAIAPSPQFAVLGGTTQGPGYTLTTAEAGRIRADTLRVNAPALGANPALIVRDLTLTGGGAAAGIGLLDIVTPGVARVEGALLMNGARPADGIAIAAGQRLEVVTPTASIRVRDGAGAPGGTLALNSANIWIASDAIITLLRANPDYAGRDDDLIDNDGIDAPRGYVEANAVTLTVNGTAYVQNTTAARGTFLSGSDFGGITTGAGGLTIVAGAPNTNVYVFGRRLNPDGTFQTGDDYFFASTYNSNAGANYTPSAALNTCIIVTGQCPLRAPPDTGVDGPDPFTGPTEGSMAILLPRNDEDDVIDSSFAADPLVEEPVTSGSEPGLWNCDPDHDGDCDDQPQ
ncbi:MAG TPA: hypothetical protein VEC11_06505 [Allosphingosinicella sp.]|nr:hypothetical protein [Allosphingosinicella sp.]